MAGDEDVGEAVLRDEQEEGGGDADERVSTQAGGLEADLALEADERGEAEGGEELEELAEAFSVGFGGEHGEWDARSGRRGQSSASGEMPGNWREPFLDGLRRRQHGGFTEPWQRSPTEFDL